MWLDEVGSEETVRNTWESTNHTRQSRGLRERLNRFRQDLLKWSKDKFENNKIQISEVQAKIEQLQGMRNVSHSQRDERLLKARLADHSKRAETYWK